MINANAHIGAQKQDANTGANAAGETGTQLRERLRVKERAFQAMWKRTLGYAFNANKICTPEEVEVMEGKYIGKKMKRVGRKAASNVVPPTAVILDKIEVVEASVVFNKFRTPALFVAFIIPTIASVSNTFLVSHALSGNAYTSAALTGVASATSILFLWAGVKGATSWAVVLLTLGFEAFCNAASVFKSLMASLSYSITTVSGKPSDFLDMVSNFIGRDHQDVAKGIAYLVAVMIASAQVSSLYELKKMSHNATEREELLQINLVLGTDFKTMEAAKEHINNMVRPRDVKIIVAQDFMNLSVKNEPSRNKKRYNRRRK